MFASMKPFRIIYLIIIACIFVLPSAFAQNTKKRIPSDFCVDENAYALYQAINNYRQKLSLDPIPLSASLSYLAQLHVKDLAANFDMKNAWKSECGMKSWSDKGHWKAFCYPKDQSKKRDIKDKAKELTPYKGKAWEILYWENDWAPDAEKILHFWLDIPQSADMLSNTGKYAQKDWQSIGLASSDGYISVFLGRVKDTQAPPIPCHLQATNNMQNTSDIQTNNTTTAVTQAVVPQATSSALYHIIAASFNNKTDAETSLANYIKKGYANAKIISTSSTKYRISLGQYTTAEEAYKDLKTIQKQQKDAWLLRM